MSKTGSAQLPGSSKSSCWILDGHHPLQPGEAVESGSWGVRCSLLIAMRITTDDLQQELAAENQRHQATVTKIRSQLELSEWLDTYPPESKVRKRLGFNPRAVDADLPNALNEEQAFIMWRIEPHTMQGLYFHSAKDCWKKYV